MGAVFRLRWDIGVSDLSLAARAQHGDQAAYDAIVRRYLGFVRMKASPYFIVGAEHDDLIQEGLIGLYEAARDFNPSCHSRSFRNFAELCINRQIISAVIKAQRLKYASLNKCVSFSSPLASAQEGDPTLAEVIPGSAIHDPINRIIILEELRSLATYLSGALSKLESRVLGFYLDGYSYEQIGRMVGLDEKCADNALQRIRRKAHAYLEAYENPPTCPELLLAA